MNRMKWTWLISVFLLAGLIIAANVKVQYTGPQGQGDVQWAKTSDGTVQLQLGTTSLIAVDTLAGTLTGDVTGDVTGDLTGAQPVVPSTVCSTNYTIVAADYGSMLVVTGAVTNAFTLPANGAAIGSWVEVRLGADTTDDTAVTISAATVDTLVGPNDQDLDSVTWASGQRINAAARFWSDGAFWHVENLGGTTMTYTD